MKSVPQKKTNGTTTQARPISTNAEMEAALAEMKASGQLRERRRGAMAILLREEIPGHLAEILEIAERLAALRVHLARNGQRENGTHEILDLLAAVADLRVDLDEAEGHFNAEAEEADEHRAASVKGAA